MKMFLVHINEAKLSTNMLYGHWPNKKKQVSENSDTLQAK